MNIEIKDLYPCLYIIGSYSYFRPWFLYKPNMNNPKLSRIACDPCSTVGENHGFGKIQLSDFASENGVLAGSLIGNRKIISNHKNSKLHCRIYQMLKKQYVKEGITAVNQLVIMASASTPTELHLKMSYKMALNKHAMSSHADDMLIHDEYGNPNIKVGEHCKTDKSAKNAIISIR